MILLPLKNSEHDELSERLITVRFQVPSFLGTGGRGYSIDPGSFEGEMAQWLKEKLERSGLTALSGIVRGVYSSRFHCVSEGVRYSISVGYRPERADDAGAWLVAIEPPRQSAALGVRQGAGSARLDVAAAVYEILASSPGVTGVALLRQSHQ